MELKTLILAVVMVVLPSWAAAQVYNCNGTYTNRPCDDTAPADVPEVVSDDQLKRAKSEKKSLIHELITENFNARRQYGVEVSLTTVENRCSRDDVSFEDCERSVGEARAVLDERIRDAKLVNAQERANDIEEEKLRRAREQTQVIVIQNNLEYLATPTPVIIDHSGIEVSIGDGNGNHITGSIGESGARPQARGAGFTPYPLAPQPRDPLPPRPRDQH